MDVIEEDSEKTQQDPTQITEVLDIKPTSPIVLPVSAKSQGAFFSKVVESLIRVYFLNVNRFSVALFEIV